ncbi:MAG: GNAT family N-acetyltransferase [Planctomycetes bacterium]|nr:GNAT family N-acetyltransferase [Planctomycetota bacterium]
MKRMRHLVLGLGSIGARHVATLLRHGHEVVGYDPAPRGGDLGGAVLANIDEAWATDPAMVWICTPTHLHAEQAIAALDRGCHVFVEKPVAADMAGAERLRAHWNSLNDAGRGRLVWVGCNMRYHEGPRRLKEVLDAGAIGRARVVRIHFSHYLPNMRPGVDYRQTYAAYRDQGGGVVLDDIHDIDLALWLSGPARKVTAAVACTGQLEMDAEDVADICLRHESGAVSEIHMDYLRREKSRGIEVIGERGTLEWRSRGKNPERAELVRYGIEPGDVETLWQAELATFDAMFDGQLADILAATEDRSNWKRNLDGAVEALAIALKARDCVDDGGRPPEGGRAVTEKPSATRLGPDEPVLETSRLTLRPLRPQDVTDEYVNGLNDPEVNRYLMAVKRTRQTRATVERFVATNRDAADCILFGLFVRGDSSPLIGTMRVSAIDLHDFRATIGVCVFAKRAWKKGYASEALAAVVGYLFGEMGLHYLEAGAYEENANSVNLFRRGGFRESYRVRDKARFEDRFMDLVFLGLVNPDFDMSRLREAGPSSGR